MLVEKVIQTVNSSNFNTDHLLENPTYEEDDDCFSKLTYAINKNRFDFETVVKANIKYK